MRRVFSRYVAVLCCLIMVLDQVSAPLRAATSTWNGSVDDTWNMAGNWTPSGVPASDINNTDLVFTGTTNINPNSANISLSIHSITFDSAAGAFVISGNTQTTGAGGITNNSTSAQTINTGLVLGTAQNFNAASGNMTFGGAIDNGGNLLTVSGSHVVTFNGAISNSGGLTLSGTGTTILASTNTYSGTTTIGLGTKLQVGNGAANGTLGTNNVVDNGTLSFDQTSSLTVANNISGSGGLLQFGSGTTRLSGANSYTGGTTITGGTLQDGGGFPADSAFQVNGGVLDTQGFNITMSALNGTGGGTISLGGGNLTIANSTANTFTGTISSSGGGLIVAGTAPFTLAGSQSYTGGTTINGGSTLQIGNGGSTSPLGTGDVTDNGILNFIQTDSTTASNNITGTGSLEQTGTGTTILAGTNSYTGGTTVTNGTLQGDTNSLQGNIGLVTPGNVTFSQSTTGTYGNATTGIGGTGTVTVAGTSTLIFAGTNSYSGGTTINSGATLQVGNGTVSSSAGTGPVTDNGTLIYNQAPSSTTVVSNSISGTGGLVQAGANTVILSGTNSYAGATTINSGSTLQIGNAGTFGTLGTGAVTDNGVLSFDRNDDVTVSNSISGTGSLVQAGTNTVTLSGTNTYTGATTIHSGGTLQIGDGGADGSIGTGAVSNAGTLAFNRSDSTTIANTITGTGTLHQVGTGLTTLTGMVAAGNTIIDAGQMNVDSNNFASPVTVNSAGTLGGIGNITGAVNNFGTVTPGNTANPQGTLNVTGDYEHQIGATFTANIAGPGDTSVLNVTGTATLDGGTVVVTSSTGSANAGAKYTFLTANSVTGIFNNATTENLPSFLVPVLGYTDDTAFVTLLRNGETYAAVGNTFNERAVGHYLDQVSPNATGDLQTVFDTLNSIDDDQLRSAESQMAGAIHGTLGQIGVQNTSLIIGQVAQRLRSSSFDPDPCCSCCGSSRGQGCSPAICSGCLEGSLFAPIPCGESGSNWTGWGQGFGLGGNLKSDGNATGTTYSMGGLLAGIERWLDDSRLIGFYGGYVGTSVTPFGPNDQINGGNFGGYFYSDDGFNYYTMMTGFEFDSYTTQRNMVFGDIDRTASADYNGWQAYGYLERGVSYESCGRLFQPFAALQYIYLRQNSFNEHGAGAIDLAADGANTNSLRSLLGARMQWAIMQRNGRRSLPEIHAYWMHEYCDSHTIVEATFTPTPDGGGTPFVAHGLDLGRDWAVAGAGFTWELPCGWSMFVNSDIQANSQAALFMGSGGIGHVW